MTEDKPTSALELYRRSVVKLNSDRRDFGMLAAEDPLPIYPDGDQYLHPYEIAIFDIDVNLRWELYEAWCWYAGAIALMESNDYKKFADEERKRFPHLVKTTAEDIARRRARFDYDDCARFMHEAAGLPLRQCEAWCAKSRATEIRDYGYHTYKDEC